MGAESPRLPVARSVVPPHQVLTTRVDDPGAVAVVEAYDIVIAGAGPAGLTGAYELTRHGRPCVVLEADPRMVGGISRTDEYKGYRFDIGGHRFFSKSSEINQLWREILGNQFITRTRMSRIYYRRKFFDYPLKPADAFLKLGPITAVGMAASYALARLRPIRPERSFEDWVVNRFGRMLFTVFFKTYTEKVWGTPCSEISADWAAQRIKGLSLTKAVWNGLFGGLMAKGKGEVIKTLIDRFEYPKLGPGQMWEAARDKITAARGAVHQDRKVVAVEHDGSSVNSFLTRDSKGKLTRYHGKHFLSTMPIRELIRAMSPAAPPAVREAAESLKYRDFLTVVLIVDKPETFPDTWLYIHEPGVHVGRVQVFKNWSPSLVPDPSKSSLGMEYFCFEGDGLWAKADDELIKMATQEIDQIGLCKAGDVIDGCVVRMPKAYPVYDDVYQNHLKTIREWLETLPNLELAGRNGMHKYNNQDHSMMTALLAARNILGVGNYDTWKVNTDAEYHEEGEEAQDMAGRLVPRAVEAY